MKKIMTVLSNLNLIYVKKIINYKTFILFHKEILCRKKKVKKQNLI